MRIRLLWLSRTFFVLIACGMTDYLFSCAPVSADPLNTKQQKEVDELTKQIEARPNDYLLWAKRGFVYRDAHDLDKAKPDFEQAIHCDPNWQQGYILRAAYLVKNGDSRKAIETMKVAESLGPLDHSTLAWRGSILAELKEYSLAIADFDKSIELDPSDYDVYATRACAKMALYGATKDVEADLEKCLSINPSDDMDRKILDEVRAKMRNQSTNK